jgi:hypothetical protein
VPLCPPQIPHDLTRARTRAAAVGSRRLTAWAMARPPHPFIYHHEHGWINVGPAHELDKYSTRAYSCCCCNSFGDCEDNTPQAQRRFHSLALTFSPLKLSRWVGLLSPDQKPRVC